LIARLREQADLSNSHTFSETCRQKPAEYGCTGEKVQSG
jgi:hypothetical protein